mmetsp:Transcript_49159/g.104979  ORF Transcript_49159/g.104979 Transcript_49159/m.104979 type:complete len:226 (+) Transcript_49159:593-1270(+)
MRQRAEGGTQSRGNVLGSGSPRFVRIVRCMATANQSSSRKPSLFTSTRLQIECSVVFWRPERLSTGATLAPETLPASGCIWAKIESYLALSASDTAHGTSAREVPCAGWAGSPKGEVVDAGLPKRPSTTLAGWETVGAAGGAEAHGSDGGGLLGAPAALAHGSELRAAGGAGALLAHGSDGAGSACFTSAQGSTGAAAGSLGAAAFVSVGVTAGMRGAEAVTEAS